MELTNESELPCGIITGPCFGIAASSAVHSGALAVVPSSYTSYLPSIVFMHFEHPPGTRRPCLLIVASYLLVTLSFVHWIDQELVNAISRHEHVKEIFFKELTTCGCPPHSGPEPCRISQEGSDSYIPLRGGTVLHGNGPETRSKEPWLFPQRPENDDTCIILQVHGIVHS